MLKPTGGALFDPTSPSCEDSAPAASAGQDILRLYTIYLEREEGSEGEGERQGGPGREGKKHETKRDRGKWNGARKNLAENLAGKNLAENLAEKTETGKNFLSII